jgi:ATP-binding cassette subfamily F protein 3
MIILDEPTNHLDVDSREALVMAINDYDGAFILISHDRHLVETCADRLWLVADGTVAPYEGDLDDYRKWLLDPARRVRPMTPEELEKEAGEDASASNAPRPSHDKKEARRIAAQKREQFAPLKKKAQAAEKEVEKLQADIARLDAKLADAAAFEGKPDEAAKVAKARADALRALAAAEDLWLEAVAAYDEAMAS